MSAGLECGGNPAQTGLQGTLQRHPDKPCLSAQYPLDLPVDQWSLLKPFDCHLSMTKKAGTEHRWKPTNPHKTDSTGATRQVYRDWDGAEWRTPQMKRGRVHATRPQKNSIISCDTTGESLFGFHLEAYGALPTPLTRIRKKMEEKRVLGLKRKPPAVPLSGKAENILCSSSTPWRRFQV